MQILKYIFIGLLIFLTCGCGGKKKQGEFRYFRNYQRTFNDLNDKHLKAARQWGIQPVTSDELLEEQMGKLDKIGSCRYYQVDELTHSIPYLVPRAEKLLKTIGRNFQDSLSSKGLSSRKIIVTSVLRTTGNVKKLRKKNVNASANSAHVYGTTFDVAYARYKGAEKEETDKLKSVLAEVLQDLQQAKEMLCPLRIQTRVLSHHCSLSEQVRFILSCTFCNEFGNQLLSLKSTGLCRAV